MLLLLMNGGGTAIGPTSNGCQGVMMVSPMQMLLLLLTLRRRRRPLYNDIIFLGRCSRTGITDTPSRAVSLVLDTNDKRRWSLVMIAAAVVR